MAEWETRPKRKQYLALLTALALGLSLCLAMFWLVGVRPVPIARATTLIIVNTTDDELNNDSDCSLREAIQTANLNTQSDLCDAGTGTDIIRLPAGTFALTIIGSGEEATLSGDLDITEALTITGDGPGLTIIDAGGLGDRVFDIRPGTGPVFFSGVTIINGNVTGNGGGIFHAGTDLRLNNTVVSSNTASSDGGGVFVSVGRATLNGGQILSNTASFGGGGVFVANSSAAFTQTGASIIAYNTSSINGGGVLVSFGRATLSDGEIISNTGNIAGGGLFVGSGNATLNGGQILSNTAGEGGGVFVNASSATFTQTGVSTIAYNAANSGGGIYIDSGNTLLSGGQILSNTATAGNGGGVYVGSGNAMLSGGQIISNSAVFNGGGVYVNASSATFTQTSVSAIAHNIANSVGGGIYVAAGRAAIVEGQILSNTASLGGGLYVHSGRATLSGGQIISNASSSNGGGVVVALSSGIFTQTGASIIGSNTASTNGGGVHVSNGSAMLSGGQIVDNVANNGGGLYQNSGSISVTGSCIVSNTDVSVFRAVGPTMTATGNWWGAADGPAGLGPGSGDSVSAGIDFSGFLTTAISICPPLLPAPEGNIYFLPIILKD